MKRIILLVVLFVIDILYCDMGASAQNKAKERIQESKIISLKKTRYDYESVIYYDGSSVISYVQIHDVANYRSDVMIPNTIPWLDHLGDIVDESVELEVIESWVPYAPGWVQYVVCNQNLEKEIVPLVLRCFSKKEREFLKKSNAKISFDRVFVDSFGKLLEQEIGVSTKNRELGYGAINPKHLIKIDKMLKKRMTFEDFGVMDMAGLPYLADFYWRFEFKDESIRLFAKGFSTWDHVLKGDNIEMYKDHVEFFRKEFSKYTAAED